MKHKLLSLLLTWAVLYSFLCIPISAGAVAPNSGFIEDEFLVTTREGQAIIVIEHEYSMKCKNYSCDDFKEIGCVKVTNLLPSIQESIQKGDTSTLVNFSKFRQIYLLDFICSSNISDDEIYQKLEERDDVMSAEPNGQISAAATPNDLYYSNQWAPIRIGLTSAWNITTGSSSVKVGVLDSGIRYLHNDLSDAVITSLCRKFTSGYLELDTNPTDVYGHGTHVAGIIGASGNNSIGIAGVCWNIGLVSLKVLDNVGVGTESSLVLALDYAASNNIPIINASLDSSGVTNASSSATSIYSGLVVCSAGNSNLNLDVNPNYTSTISADNVIVVGASDSADEKWSLSNYGVNTVDLFAPGVNIYSCSGNTYANKTGTSMAAPQVAGTAALLLSKYPTLSAFELKHLIVHGVDIIRRPSNGSSVFGNYCSSGGRLNSYKPFTKVTSQFSRTNISIYSGHRCVCTDCGAINIEDHCWSSYSTYYRCTECGVTSTYIPVIIP